MKAAIFKGPLDLEVGEYPLSKLGSDDLLIKVEVCGLCGTDFHIFSGQSFSKPPLIPGHEYAGTIVEKGSKVLGLNVGDHIVVDPNIYCGKCYFCRTGKIQFCSNLKALGVTQNGGFAEYSILPSSQAYLIPKDFPFPIASFAEPLSCCVHGIDQASIKHSQTVAIVGAGTIGLLMLQLSQIAGAGKTIVLEPFESKRNLAKRIGADYCFDSKSSDTFKYIYDITSGGVDVVIECVGSHDAAEIALTLPKRGGTAIIFGLSEKVDSVKINLQDFFLRELTIKGSLLNPFTFSRSVELLVSGKIDVESLKPVHDTIDNLKKILSQPRNYSVTKYQITPN